jgi:hypothetical protein
MVMGSVLVGRLPIASAEVPAFRVFPFYVYNIPFSQITKSEQLANNDRLKDILNNCHREKTFAPFCPWPLPT